MSSVEQLILYALSIILSSIGSLVLLYMGKNPIELVMILGLSIVGCRHVKNIARLEKDRVDTINWLRSFK